ncbi:MAG: NAD-dependent epimerase/dehydratase family protein [Anaerolineales bacterium]
MAERALVTGATGFIGYHLVRELARSGANVTCLVRSTSDTEAIEPFNPQFVLGDILQEESLVEATSNADVVFHLAAAQESFKPQDYYDLNVGGTRNLVEACARHESPPIFVYVSSLAAAGPTSSGNLLTERDAPSPFSHYGKSKLAAEEVVRAWAHEVPITIVRPPIVFGEYDKDVFQVFQYIKYGIHLVLPPRETRYSLIHASDLSQGLIDVAREGERLEHEKSMDPSGKGLYYLADDVHTSWGELGELISESLGRKSVRLIRVPRLLTLSFALVYELGARIRGTPGIVSFDKARDAFAGSWVCSAEKATKQLGFKPEVSLKDRMHQTAQWYLDNGWL